MAQNVYKFDRGVLEEHEVERVQIIKRGEKDWVCFLWTRNAQQAPGQGENSLEALEKAISYLDKTFQFPLLAGENMSIPDRRQGIRRNSRGRLLSTKEMILERFLAKKAEMDVVLPQDDIQDDKCTVIFPVGYEQGQIHTHSEVALPEEELKNLRTHLDDLNPDVYKGQNRYLTWLKTLASKIHEIVPYNQAQPATVATFQYGTNKVCYFRVDKINREINSDDPKPVIINFSRTENFQVQIFDINPHIVFPGAVPEGSPPWIRVDL